MMFMIIFEQFFFYLWMIIIVHALLLSLSSLFGFENLCTYIGCLVQYIYFAILQGPTVSESTF